MLQCPFDLTLTCSGHVATIGDVSANADGYLGTAGQALGLEGCTVVLAESERGKYFLTYMARVSWFGDTAWVHEGHYCGIKGLGRYIEGLEIKIRPIHN